MILLEKQQQSIFHMWYNIHILFLIFFLISPSQEQGLLVRLQWFFFKKREDQYQIEISKTLELSDQHSFRMHTVFP